MNKLKGTLTNNQRQKIMKIVWGSFSASGPDVIHFINGTMDQHMYLNILKESLSLCKQKLCLGENIYF